jgi:uncharacterized protein YndB with AHSA1/START domain
MTNALTVNAPDGLPYIDTAREFEAPVESVFRAYRDPDLLKQWLGPGRFEMDIERHDFVTQGGFRWTHRAEGEEYRFNGVFHTVRDNELAIQTFEYDGAPDQVSIEFLTFTDLGDGRSRLSGHAVYPSVEARDAMVSSGMESGMAEGYDKLDELLASVASAR